MDKIETIEEFYKRKFDWMPDNIKNEIGHFNVFRLEPFVGDKAQPVPYKWEHLDNMRGGSFCIFNQHFFHQYGDLNQYSVFQPNGTHINENSAIHKL